MSAQFVWVQLYYKEEEKPVGQVFKIKPVPDDVDDLASAVKVARPNGLSHCDAANLFVYAPGTTSFSEENAMGSGKKLTDVIEELKNTTPPTSCDHPLIVVASPRQQLATPATKKQRTAYQFGGRFDRFVEYLDDSINNVVEDTVIYECDDVEQEILRWLEPEWASQKPNCVTIWSGRGSGKTSLIRKIALSSGRVQAARDCGRLMIIDANKDIVGRIQAELKSNPDRTSRFLVTLVGYHLCKVFEESSVDGVDFTRAATVEDLWEKRETMPSSLLEKLESIRNGEQAYDWWKSCTRGFLSSNEGHGPNPIIIIDAAEVLAVANDLQEAGRRYSVLEWLMMRIPNNPNNRSSIVAFATGQPREFSTPLDFQSHVNHKEIRLSSTPILGKRIL